MVCALLVAFWEIMVARSRGGHQGYRFTGQELAGFRPQVQGWTVTLLPVRATRAEPNIVVYGLDRSGATTPSTGRVVVRLVHGYNVRDCMRLKGYQVELVGDTRRRIGNDDRGVEASLAGDEIAPVLRSQTRAQGDPFPVQVWRLIAPTDDIAIWVTSMLRTADFGATDVDVRSMPFPKIEGDDRPVGLPEGLTWESLRHPIRTLGLLVRTRWNNARCDLATFLGLRTPAWASDELLTLVSASSLRPEGSFDSAKVLGEVLEAHLAIAEALGRWRSANPLSQ
ncbi:MAG: hypothetical protein ACUVWX_10725 [Kiritimatiellia bacterium]